MSAKRRGCSDCCGEQALDSCSDLNDVTDNCTNTDGELVLNWTGLEIVTDDLFAYLYELSTGVSGNGRFMAGTPSGMTGVLCRSGFPTPCTDPFGCSWGNTTTNGEGVKGPLLLSGVPSLCGNDQPFDPFSPCFVPEDQTVYHGGGICYDSGGSLPPCVPDDGISRCSRLVAEVVCRNSGQPTLMGCFDPPYEVAVWALRLTLELVDPCVIAPDDGSGSLTYQLLFTKPLTTTPAGAYELRRACVFGSLYGVNVISDLEGVPGWSPGVASLS